MDDQEADPSVHEMHGSVRKAVIPAAGLGTRLLPLTRSIPKELLPVGAFPMIHWCVGEAALAGIQEIILVIRSGKEAVRSYCDDEWPGRDPHHLIPERAARIFGRLKFTFVYQEMPRGPGDAILKAKAAIGDEPFALMFPDDLFLGGSSALVNLVELFTLKRQMVTGLITVRPEEGIRFGNCGRVDLEPLAGKEAGKIFRIRNLHTKGPGHFVVRGDREIRWTGRHVLLPSFLDHLSSLDSGQGELDDVEAFQQLIRSEIVLGRLLECEVFDVGNKEGYLRANALLAGRGSDDYLSF